MRLKAGPRRCRESNSQRVFQSHCGAIKSRSTCLPRAQGFSFNPTVVRLKGGGPGPGAHPPHRFQSHCGAIKSRDFVHPGTCIEKRFNPTVVRLKARGTSYRTDAETMFQSHCGAIKSNRWESKTWSRKQFQSHCGAIKRLPEVPPHAPRPNVSIPLWCD